MKFVGFSPQDAARIGRAVKKVERDSGPIDPTSPQSVYGPDGFFIKLTSKSGSNYAWTQVVPLDDGTWEENTDIQGTTSENFAKEANNVDTTLDSIVFARPRHDYFVFNSGNSSPHYAVVPKCGTGVGARSGSTPGSGFGCLFVVHNGSLTPVLDSEENNVAVNFYNVSNFSMPTFAPPNEKYILVHQDANGNWLCEIPLTQATTTTTAEPTPGDGLPGGQCKWEWIGSYWLQIESNCSSVAATTTTTADPLPCICDAESTTTTSEGEDWYCVSSGECVGEGTCGQYEEMPEDACCETAYETLAACQECEGCNGTTTTTPEPEWTCKYPDFCGTEIGQCTYTECILEGTSQDYPDCPGPTTTTTAAPTTTEDPGSTTTPDCTGAGSGGETYESCIEDCTFEGHPSGSWVLTGAGCGSKTGCDGIVNLCGGCTSPEEPWTLCGVTSTSCIRGTNPGCPPPPPSCGGGFYFVCWKGSWAVMNNPNNGCTGDGTVCTCGNTACGCNNYYVSGGCHIPNYPSESCPECGDITYRGCTSGGCTPCGGGGTTTLAPCVTTAAPPSTTTTANPCGTGCLYTGDGSGGWNLDENNCLGECTCSEPGRASNDECDTVNVVCTDIDPPTTTTTTPEPTTTTTPAPTTTTTAEPTSWYCINDDYLTCDNAYCAEMTASEHTAGVIAEDFGACGGAEDTQEECEVSYCAPTTTTTLPPDWYCCDDGGGCTCQEGECSSVTCSGPHADQTACEAVCITTTTTSCDPMANCGSANCIFICNDDNWPVSGHYQVNSGCAAQDDSCRCDLTPEIEDLIGQECSPPAEVISSLGPCCNDCPGSTNPCTGTSTTPAP